ncbi:MFS transporter [Salinisphaera sp. LB1]|uniref:MFS transporter n=1 Tax=Salinisphaera sp. LB1 TaxID=2183911 RepID=UPI001313EDEB|nr:MFS transporter [Salinisphaera sp. LB1]
MARHDAAARALPDTICGLQRGTCTKRQQALGVALFTGAYAISAPALAPVSARYTTRMALLAGMGVFTLGNIITALAPTLGVFLTARLIAGVGAGMYSPLATSSAANMVSPSQRGRALSLVLAGLSVGTALGVPFGLLIEAYFGWRSTIALIVFLGLLSAFGLMMRAGAYPESEPMAWRERLGALKDVFTLSTLGVTLWTGIASLGLYTYIAEILSSRAMGAVTDTFIWLWGIGGMLGALLIGRFIDRYVTPIKATSILISLLGVGFVLVGYAPIALAGAGCFIWGLCGWASMAPQQHALVTHAPRHAAASVAWNSSANYLGSGIGAALGSAALGAHLAAAWLPVGALMAASIALLIHLIKARKAHVTESPYGSGCSEL